jgi:two-component system, cell cycle response regulator
MTATVLVVDDVDANVKLLEARLTADYFEVGLPRTAPKPWTSACGSAPMSCSST